LLPPAGPVNPPCRPAGYSLLEILAVLAVMAMSAAVMAPVVMEQSDRELTARTLEGMEAVRAALLGKAADRVRGGHRFAGYVQDMGSLPVLYDVLGTPNDPSDDQPRGLWTSDPAGTPENEGDDLPARRPYLFSTELEPHYSGSLTEKTMESIVRMGWQGPYIRPPSGAGLEDGWKNPLRFALDRDGLTVTSLGADGKAGGRDADRDLTLTIAKNQWTGSVAGHISPIVLAERADTGGQMDVLLFFAPADCTPVTMQNTPAEEPVALYPMSRCGRSMQTVCDPDGFFRFEGVPLGTQRFLLAGGRGYEIAVEPGLVWLGTLGLLQ